MKTLKKIFFVFTSLIFSFNGFSQIEFDNLNLNDNDELLYNLTKTIPGKKKYSTLFSYKIENEQSINAQNRPKILTCFPEKISSTKNGEELQIINNFGSAIYSFKNNSLKWNSFVNSDLDIFKTITNPVVSPTGKYFCFLQKVGTSKAKLILQNSENHKKIELDKEANFSFDEVPAIWSANGKFLIYQKNNSLYFSNVENLFNGLEVDEKYRKIGNGKINCVQWINENYFAFIDLDIVYLINANDFSSLGIYSNIFSIGSILGRLPNNFEIENSKFEINQNATEILIIKNNSTIYYYQVNQKNKTDYLTLVNAKSYRDFFDDSYKIKIFWKGNLKPIILVDCISLNGKKDFSFFTFNQLNEIVELSLTKENNLQNYFSCASLSPDGKYFAAAFDDELFIYQTNNWSLVTNIKGEKINSLCFKNRNELCIGGDETVQLYNINLNESSFLFLSSVENATWNKNFSDVISYNKNYKIYFKYNLEKNIWEKIQNVESLEIFEPQIQNKNYRVYKASTKNEKFANGIFVRNLSAKTNTFALYKEVLQKNQKQKKIALVFDLTNNANGVNEIIALTEKYNLNISYFVNGEFIRRYPSEVRKIAFSGQEVGSLFYTNINLVDSDFEITNDFIKRGLARNEDEYFECTGKELSLFWHAPFYKSTKLIRESGNEAGYSYVDFPTDQEFFESKSGKTLESQIIPISVGLSSDSQKTIFYNKLELLINSLLEANYKIVPVSEL